MPCLPSKARSTEVQPLVSVIIPAYNAEAFIAQTLESVIAQTYKNFEVIVIDDGSEDGTAEVVRKFVHHDSRVSLVQQDNAGVAFARNRAIQLARGELIAPIDADDVWLPNNLEQQVTCMVQSDSSVGVVYTWSFDIDENNVPTGTIHAFKIAGDVYATLLCHYFLGNGSCSLIRRASLEKVGFYQGKATTQGCEDWEMYLRLAERYQFAVVPHFLVGYRKRSHSLSGDDITMANQLNREIWQPTLQKHPHLELISRLSKSSFFLYLARQNSLLGRHQRTLFWLGQSIKIDFFTPFLRPGFYALLLESILGQLLGSWNFTISSKSKKRSMEVAHSIDIPLLSPSENRLPVQLQAIVGNFLHKSILFFFGTSNYLNREKRDASRRSNPLG